MYTAVYMCRGCRDESLSIDMPGKGESKSIKMLTPDKAARTIIDGIEHNRYRVLVGSDATLMDAVYRLSPQRAARFIYNQMRALLPA